MDRRFAGPCSADRSNLAADAGANIAIAAPSRRCGKRSAFCACAAPRPSASRRRWASSSACKRTTEPASYAARLEGSRRLPAHQPADRGQSLLGHRTARKESRGRSWTKRSPAGVTRSLLEEALAIEEEDRAMCRAIGRFGAELVQPGQGMLTHCNAGGLATAEYGTALAVMFTAAEQGKQFQRLRRRDPAAAARGPADRLGIAASRHRRHADLRQHGRPGDERREDSAGDRRRRPHRRQRRHRQQDRHLRRRGPGPRSRHPVLRRRPVEHLRSEHRGRQRKFRSSSAIRARSPKGFGKVIAPGRRRASTIPLST